MKPATRNRVLRNFVATLLQSDLSGSELQGLADELESGTLAKDIVVLLRELDLYLSATNQPTNYRREDIAIEEKVYQLILSRKLSKKIVYELMKISSPHLSQPVMKSIISKPVHEAVQEYMRRITDADRMAFLDVVSGKSADPYLKGINRKS